MIRPKNFRATISTELSPEEQLTYIDNSDVLSNGFSPESITIHKPVKKTSEVTTGSETEVSILGASNSQNLLDSISVAMKAAELNGQIIKGEATPELLEGIFELNRPVVSATFENVVGAIRFQNRVGIQEAAKIRGRVSFESAGSTYDPDRRSLNDPYIQKMVGLLAKGKLNISDEFLTWLQFVSGESLDIANKSIAQIREQIVSSSQTEDMTFAKKVVEEYDCKGHHVHVKTSEKPNPNFYAFALNHLMGHSAIKSTASFSGPFKNGMYAGVHEIRQIQKYLLGTAGVQEPYLAMGSSDLNDMIATNLRDNDAASLSRAIIPGAIAHGTSRLRVEPKLQTAEFIISSTHPLPEVEATQVMTNVYDMAILSHYYSGKGITGEIPAHAQRFYAMQNGERYEKNRIAIAENGAEAIIEDGLGQQTSYAKYMEDYSHFLETELVRLGIETPPGEIKEVTGWLRKSALKPQELNISHYLNPTHPEYGVGNFSTHMIGELVARVKKNNDVRYLPWEDLKNKIQRGSYKNEISGIIDTFMDLTDALYLKEQSSGLRLRRSG